MSPLADGCNGLEDPMMPPSVRCEDCHKAAVADGELSIICADLGQGAFLAVLCDSCCHRRQYRAELVKRKVALAR